MVSRTFLSVTGASTGALKMKVLDKIPCIHYLVQFHKDKGKDVLALLNSGSKVNAIAPAYAAHLGLQVRVTDVVVQKIDKFSLITYGMVIALFQVVNKLGRFWFFQETLLLANISMEVFLGMSFLTFSNTNVQFVEKKLT